MMAVGQSPTVPPPSHDSIAQPQSVKPSFKIIPGYIASFGLALVEGITESESLEAVKYLKVDILNPEIWKNHTIERRKNIINEHKFIYFKLDATDNSLLEVGIHFAMCKKIEEFKLEKIRLGDSIRDENPKMVVVKDTGYARLLKMYLPLLEGDVPTIYV